MSKIEELIRLLRAGPPIYIQTHDDPDPDAVGSAYGLYHLLQLRGIQPRIVYAGRMAVDPVARLVEDLGIPLEQAREVAPQPPDRIVIVDGCKGSGHVSDLPGRAVAAIDHHEVAACEELPFMDARPEYGSCSTIVFTYFRDLSLEIPPSVSTALLTGLLVDTALMTRHVSRVDLSAYASLYTSADIALVNALLRNRIQKKDLAFYRAVLENVRIQDRFAFYCFRETCNPNLLGIIGDFLLTLREVRFVLLCAPNNGNIHLSARSEAKGWNAAVILKELLQGSGFGGGHAEMAGGIVTNPRLFDKEEVFRRLSAILKRFPPPP